jgi:hypothetical protein
MPIGSLLLGAAVIVLVGLFLARPLLLSQNDKLSRITAHQDLLNQKETILAQIEILDFDFETGTLPEQTYKSRRRQLVAQAADILKRLDDYADMVGTTADDQTAHEIETAVAKLRGRKVTQQRPASAPAPANARPQPLAAEPEPTAQTVPTNGQVKFCAQCGRPVEASDKFCAYCGYKIPHA